VIVSCFYCAATVMTRAVNSKCCQLRKFCGATVLKVERIVFNFGERDLVHSSIPLSDEAMTYEFRTKT
jgi:hypothetical protein